MAALYSPLVGLRSPHHLSLHFEAAVLSAQEMALLKGYYPFGSRFFSDLTHYVRSGQRVQLPNDNLDIGEVTDAATYKLADQKRAVNACQTACRDRRNKRED